MWSNFTDQGWYLVMARTGSETPKLKTDPMGTVCDIISLYAESTATLSCLTELDFHYSSKKA